MDAAARRSNTGADVAGVLRSNIANTVMTQDVNLMSGLQYAVDVLEVRSIREQASENIRV
jgi:carbonic anhydrase